MPYRVNARLDDGLAAKLEHLENLTGQSVTAIVRAALESYYASVCEGSGNAARILEQNGFVGCGEADADLSSDYKSHLDESVGRKT